MKDSISQGESQSQGRRRRDFYRCCGDGIRNPPAAEGWGGGDRSVGDVGAAVVDGVLVGVGVQGDAEGEIGAHKEHIISNRRNTVRDSNTSQGFTFEESPRLYRRNAIRNDNIV